MMPTPRHHAEAHGSGELEGGCLEGEDLGGGEHEACGGFCTSIKLLTPPCMMMGGRHGWWWW